MNNSFFDMPWAKKINIFCLVAAIIAVLLLPFKKDIWYDETVSILCSKGISHDAPSLFANTNTINSESIAQLNTAGNVFDATVVDNGNSFLFNIGLHWFTMLFGNSITAYTMFSKLCGVAALVAFYFLCNLFFENSLFTSVAIILLATDSTFMGMSHEIRAYSMGIFFVTLAAIYFYKFMYQSEKAIYLFLLGLFSVGAVLSHFLSLYIILVFLGGLVLVKKQSLFSVKNILSVLIPLGLVALFFYCSYTGLQQMSKQNEAIQQKLITQGFSLSEVFVRSMKFTAINFKVLFPSFMDKTTVTLASFILVIMLYITGIRIAANQTGKRNLHLLFILGISSSLFLAFLSIKSHHYTALYFRYFSFCLPFASLFTACLIAVFIKNPKINRILSWGIASIIIVPAIALSVIANLKAKPRLRYNYDLVAQKLVQNNVVKIGVPEWRDAFMFQSLLPAGYKIDYVLNPTSPYFTLYKANTEEKVLAIKDNS